MEMSQDKLGSVAKKSCTSTAPNKKKMQNWALIWTIYIQN